MGQKTISGPALAILDTILDRRRGHWRNLPEEATLEALRKLQQLGDSLVIPQLLTFPLPRPEHSGWSTVKRLFGAKESELSKVALAAAEAASQLALAAHSRELLTVDWYLRRPWSPIAWDAIEGLVSATERNVGLLGLACSHPDGHARERFVFALGAVRDGRELPFLLLRIDDWVEPVRRLALSAVQARFVPDYAPKFVGCLDVISSLSMKQRSSATKLVAGIRDWLLTPANAQALLGGLTSRDRDVQLEALTLCAVSQHVELREVIALAMGDRDFLVRFRAARLGAKRLEGVERRLLADRLLSDPHPALRANGLDLLVTLDGARARDRLEAALLDSGEAVRSTARFHLGKLGVTDFRNCYLATLISKTPRTVRIGLQGLAQTGTAEDARAVAPLLGAPSGVARAALRTLVKLDPRRGRQAAFDLLRDKRLGMSKTSALLLRGTVADADGPALWSAVCAAEGRDQARMTRLMAECSRWVALPYLLRASRLTAGAREAAASELTAWLDSYRHGPYAPPTPSAQQLDACRQALSDASSSLAPELRASLERLLRRSLQT